MVRLQNSLQGCKIVPGALQGGDKIEHSNGPISGEHPLCMSFVTSLASIQALAPSCVCFK